MDNRKYCKDSKRFKIQNLYKPDPDSGWIWNFGKIETISFLNEANIF